MEQYTGLEIAVIGLAGKFPQAGSVEQFWQNLVNGLESIDHFSAEETIAEGEPSPVVNDPAYVRSNAWMEGKEYFDAAFFGYRPAEAGLMDPQIRVFHECCWQALEDSGYGVRDHKEKIGLFASGSPNANWELYSWYQNRTGSVDDFSASHLRQITFLSTAVSYRMNLKGPSVYLHTGCSSSLVAIHEACNSLLLGECTMALAGGITLYNHSKRGYLHKEGMIMSHDGHCRPFDADSSGTVSGEGAGVVVLKRLKDALRDGDHIYAMIKGTGVNNDGSNKVGYTAPGVNGQADVIRKAHRMASVKPETISYIEAHGTATALGDPIEIEALNKAFDMPGEKTCAIGSVKSNIGHLDAAAGVAGFIKTVLALYHKKLPASLHFNKPNPRIDFEGGPFYVNNELCVWEKNGAPRRAGVSSFGIGGTNAHIVLEEAPATYPVDESRNFQLLVLSAKTKESLNRNKEALKQHIENNTGASLPDIAFTLQTGRERFVHRQVLVAANREEALQQLSSGELSGHDAGHTREALQNIIFLFTGQGSQYAGMGRNLFEKERYFREKVEECLALSHKHTDIDLLNILYPANEQDKELINDTKYAQPLLFIIEYALAQLLIHWGIRPGYMIGHSIGEYVAACLAGVFTPDDALRLVIRRGELMSSAERGSMLSVAITLEYLQPLLNAHRNVDIAVINSDRSIVLSGKHDDIALVEQELINSGHACKKLHTSHAFHSWMMDGILEKFEQEFTSVRINEPRLAYLSNISGEEIRYDEIKDPKYWSRHLRSTVQFGKGIDILLQKGDAVLIEVGPGQVLSNYARASQLFGAAHHVINLVRQPGQGIDDQRYLVERIGRCWLHGIDIDWKNYYSNEKRYRVPLPAYSFEKTAWPTIADARTLIEGAGPVNKKAAHEHSVHTSTWKRSMLPGSASELSEKQYRFLIIGGNEDVSKSLAGYLTTYGQNVIEATLTEAKDLRNCIVDHIIYCAALTGKITETDPSAIEETLQQGYIGLAELGRLIAAPGQPEKIQLTVIGNQLVRITDEDAVNPLKAAILGASKILPVELLNLGCKVIDIAYPVAGEEALMVNQIINEIFYDDIEPIVAYRYRERWVQCFEPSPVNKKLSSGVSIEKDGTYIITGSFGGMGFTLAGHLVRQYGVNLVLVHRSAFPGRADWDNWLLQKGKEDPVSNKILSIREMEAAGNRVEIYRLDVDNEESVIAFAGQVKTNHPRINGLVWAAGEVDYGGIVLNRNEKDFTRYISSKVHGLLLFQKHFDFGCFDFIALFSSIGNVFYQTKFGQVAYNAANEFLQAYPAFATKKIKAHVFTINWCDWLDVGMTVKTKMKTSPGAAVWQINEQITDGITPAEGIQFFERCLHGKNQVSIIYKGDISAAMQHEQEKLEIQKTALSLPAAGISTEGLSIMESLCAVFAAFFGINEIGHGADFFELGGDSLKGMTLIARINQQFGSKISIIDLYRCSTIRQLAEELTKFKAKTETRNIPKAPQKKYYPLSSAQKRMYFLQMLDKGSTAYNEVQHFRAKGIIDKEKWEAAVKKLLQRHESLRTGFVFHEELPVQFITDNVDVAIEYYQQEAALQSFVKPFDLSKPPLIRIGFLQQSPEDHLLMIDMHHIIADAGSHSILINDFIALYNQEELPLLNLQYTDYAEWQQTSMQQEHIQHQKQFWLNEFAEAPMALELPVDSSRTPVRSTAGDSVYFKLDSAQSRGLKQLAEMEGASLFMVLLAAYSVLLSKLSNQEDIVVGTPAAGRRHADLENMIGIFINTLPLRNYPKRELRFNEFLSILKKRTLDCFDNQDFPYEELIEELKIARDTSRNALFDAMFFFQNFERPDLDISGLSLEYLDREQTSSKFDITLTANEIEDQLFVGFEYASSLFRKQTIEKFLRYFLQIINVIIDDAKILIGDIDMMPESEKQMLLSEFNDTAVGYDGNDTVVSLFSGLVKETPGKVALVYQGRRWTYGELDELSGRIAGSLCNDYGISSGQLVSIMCERSEWLVVGLLGILRSGAAYVFVDPSYPPERIEYVLQDSGSQVLMVSKALPEDFNYSGPVLVMGSAVCDQFAQAAVHATDLCYVMYTSGSTGKPKGVMISHGNVVNFFAGMNQRLPVTKDDCMLAVTSASFDISVLELLWTLCNGIETVLHPTDISLGSLDRYVHDESQVQTDFSLFFFSSYNNSEEDKYDLLMESVQYADREGFKAVWTPERHFHEFGGLYPNPSVISAALSMITQKIELRSGSVVLPLHDSLRVAEEWSVVDNLSKGRIGLSFASGWNPNDFAISKTSYNDRQRRMYEQVEEVKRLWSGQKVKCTNGLGQEVELGVYPAPVQPELPVWITSSGNEETFRSAGAMGAHILTHFLGQEIEELARKIHLYRDARNEHGHDPATGKVTLMLHTYIGEEISEVEKLVEKPFIEYLKSSIGLSRILLEEGGVKADEIPEEEKQLFLRSAFLRYYRNASLIGTVGTCSKMVEKLRAIGVNEIACLIDFGIGQKKILEGLKRLNMLKQLFANVHSGSTKPVSVLQCTPSYMKLIRESSGSLKLLQSLRILLLGGEAVPAALVRGLQKDTQARIYNMYGPTETTIWSCMEEFEKEPDRVSVGKPIANTQVYILDKGLQLLPAGVAGDLYIGGRGVSRGYWERPMLTEERFITSPFNSGEKIYKTGDVARWLSNGKIEILGRDDQQVKIRGHRIELGEIESAMLSYASIREVVAVVKEEKGSGEKYLAAFLTAEEDIDRSRLNEHLGRKLPGYMIPPYLVQLPEMPLTPNGKTDRKALSAREIVLTGNYQAPSGHTEQRLTAIWSEVLKLDMECISVTSNFFELGGHSLKLVLMLDKVFREFSISVPVGDAFRHSNIKSLALHIQNLERSRYYAIEKTSLKEYYPLSSVQKRMYFLYEFDKTSLAYNIFTGLRLTGSLSKELVYTTIEKLIARHESLRTIFVREEDDDPVQKIMKTVNPQIDFFKATEDDIPVIIKDFIRPFDLSDGPLIRTGLIQLSAVEHIFILDMHHIIMDGISQEILIKDFIALYNGETLPALALQYKDYAEWQQDPRQQEQMIRQKNFWLNEFAEECTAIDLPADYERPLIKTYRGESLSFEVDADETHKLRLLAKTEGTTLFMVILAAYSILLSKLSNQEDMVVGVPVAGRRHPDLQQIIGMFINMLAIRSHVAGEKTVQQLLAEIKDKTILCFENQDYQYESLIEDLQVERDTSRNPLFDVILSFDPYDIRQVEIPGLGIRPYESGRRVAKFDLSLTGIEREESIQLTFDYPLALFEKETIERFVEYFRRIIAVFTGDICTRIFEIDILSEAEKQELLFALNNTARAYPNETVVSIFEKQVGKTPGNTALEHNDVHITYQSLNQQANRLAHHLLHAGAGEGSIVGLMIDRSPEMIVGIIGILKTGAAYLPIDPEEPMERAIQMLHESGAILLLTESAYRQKYDQHIHTIDVCDAEIENRETFNPGIPPDLSQRIYILYTSGSTGRPKGVIVSHRSVANLVHSQQKIFGIGEEEKILQLSTISFDASVEQIWLAFCNGATLVLIDKECITDNTKLNRYISAHQVTHLHATPSLLEIIELVEGNSLKRIIAGGEECKPQLAYRYSRHGAFYNEYGPTETTVTSIIKCISKDDIRLHRLTVGRPIENTQVYILGKNSELLPKGAKGELYVGGEGVTTGYINDPSLTHRKFLKNPFQPGRIYRTGDLARWLPDGDVDFIGRIDDQVKIRGYRIELGEIANILRSRESIKDVVVIVRGNDGDKYLVAYYVSEQEPAEVVLKNYLSDKLPAWMIPAAFVRIERIPLTSNGKLNRKALPGPGKETATEIKLPSNAIEEKLLEIWSNILKINKEKISTDSTFFQLGGHSLKATMLVNQINKNFMVEIPVREIFIKQSIGALADYLCTIKSGEHLSQDHTEIIQLAL